MKPEDKILTVLNLIEASRQLSASNRHCYLDPKAKELKSLTHIELQSILERLETEGIIEVLKTPYDVWQDVGRENEPEVYTIKTLNTFESYLDTLYEESRFGIKNLSRQNYYCIYGVAEQIHQYLNIHKGSSALIGLYDTNTNIWLYINKKQATYADIKNAKQQALSFLKQVGAIEDYRLNETYYADKHFRIDLKRRIFDRSFLELMLNSPKQKSSTLARKITENKQQETKSGYVTSTPQKPDKENVQFISPESDVETQDKVRFDAKASKLTYNGKSCNIADETLEYYICKLVFKNRRVAAKEDDILEYTTKSQESQRAVYDAMLRINKKANEQLGTPKLLSYKAAKVRITAKYQ